MDRMPLVIIPDKLMWHVTGQKIEHVQFHKEAETIEKKNQQIHAISIDEMLLYQPFFDDFGPLNLACLARFCQIILEALAERTLKEHIIYYCCGTKAQLIANAAVLVGCFQVLYLGYTPRQAYETTIKKLEPFKPFRDASQTTCTFKLTPQHCIQAVFKAHHYRFFSFNSFDYLEYEHFEAVEQGDLSVIVPGKFVAFSSPYNVNTLPDGYPALRPSEYMYIFRYYGVRTVIRLNKKSYNSKNFTQHGIEHHDLFFPDGTTPSLSILEKFFDIVENTKGTIAVHCKAGLGRTGTMIGCWLMKHYRLTAEEAIGWLRICRPGSVIAQQQNFLQSMQKMLWLSGKEFRRSRLVTEMEQLRLHADLNDDLQMFHNCMVASKFQLQSPNIEFPSWSKMASTFCIPVTPAPLDCKRSAINNKESSVMAQRKNVKKGNSILKVRSSLLPKISAKNMISETNRYVGFHPNALELSYEGFDDPSLTKNHRKAPQFVRSSLGISSFSNLSITCISLSVTDLHPYTKFFPSSNSTRARKHELQAPPSN